MARRLNVDSRALYGLAFEASMTEIATDRRN
jgi:hypothetical protein